MGSYYNAMDMEFMRRVIDAVEPMHYQGLSYGTVFGAFYLTLFPEQVGRFVLDGVVDVNYALNHRIDERIGGESFGDAEALLLYFYEEFTSISLAHVATQHPTNHPFKLLAAPAYTHRFYSLEVDWTPRLLSEMHTRYSLVSAP
ncbi:hypothetical protein EX895_005461 [Sporisorium graminicola]|uniref:AB hydrolase-1 domain-containing protein n=1 Tax=Sporisorium graminicola TaxID=280036 RepID=A0A4V6ET66_9BASI|nr:hypothetical protein EX895_005461 [Sporisorium graminicola]TKY85299.1 hypothetical protein EX895_005461 [Sporisorium graminicola]